MTMIHKYTVACVAGAVLAAAGMPASAGVSAE